MSLSTNHLRPAGFALAMTMCLLGGASGESAWSLNAVGYQPTAQKVATLRAANLEGRGKFRVVRADDGTPVLEGELVALTDAAWCHADFSALRATGRYRLTRDDTVESLPFDVAENVYVEPFRVALQAMRLWRCGAVEAQHRGDTFTHDACHLEDALPLDGVGGRTDAVGGWHDAGDYNKYVVNAGVSVGLLLQAWRDFGPRVEGVVGDRLRDEIRWELEWLLKVQRPDGSVVHKVSTRDFGPFLLPEHEAEPRYFSDWGTAATASFTAMTAAAAGAYEPHDAEFAERLREAARRGHACLVRHPEERRPNLAAFTTGGYQTSDRDDRLWALAEMWELTGEGDTLLRLDEAIRNRVARPRRERATRRPEYFDRYWGWGNVANLGLVTYLASDRDGRDQALADEVRASLRRTAERIATATADHPFGRPLSDRYYWGCNGAVAGQSLVLHAAARQEPREEFTRSRRDALAYLFGRNPFGRSFVTGLGHEPPQNPHDRRSGSDDVAAPWPGYLVGGPERGPLDWRDDQNDYRTNEIAINWNAALIYALAAELPSPNDR